VKESFDVSVPKMPVNSSASRDAAVRSASEVSMLSVLQVCVVTMLSLCWCVAVGEVVDATVDVNGELPLPIHWVAFAALARLYARSVLRVRLVNGRWATLRGVRTEPGAAKT
jgi:hypothetical protein